MPFHWPEFENDDPAFMNCAVEMVHGVVGGMGLPRYQVFRIDNWFGPKWLGFCGKLVGVLGVSNFRNVVIPPFVQNRLTAQSLFERDDHGSYSYEGNGPQIHNRGTSKANFTNFARVAAPDTTLFWISGNSMANRRGSIMSYKPGPGNYWMFYIEFQAKDGEWSVAQQKQMPPEIAEMIRAQSVRYVNGT
jgi:hypothetical protein